MPLYDCGDQDCEECRRAFPTREKAIRNYKAREAFYERLDAQFKTSEKVTDAR